MIILCRWCQSGQCSGRMIVLWNYFVAEPSSIDIALFVCESFMQIMSSYSMGLVHSGLDMPTS
jgi:hypothetical protein